MHCNNSKARLPPIQGSDAVAIKFIWYCQHYHMDLKATASFPCFGGERAQAVKRITNKKGIRSNKTY
jgi:hypothetical protein